MQPMICTAPNHNFCTAAALVDDVRGLTTALARADRFLEGLDDEV